MSLGVAIDGANRDDHKLMRQTLEAFPVLRPKPTRRCPRHLCLDGGFDYDEPRALAAEFGFTLHLRSGGEEIGPNVTPMPKRGAGWGSERILAPPLPLHSDPLGQKRPTTSPCSTCPAITCWRHALPG